jgi:hypothetical protein
LCADQNEHLEKGEGVPFYKRDLNMIEPKNLAPHPSSKLIAVQYIREEQGTLVEIRFVKENAQRLSGDKTRGGCPSVLTRRTLQKDFPVVLWGGRGRM